MANNPIIQRYRYSILRPKQLWIYIAIYVSIIVLIISINYSSYKYQSFFEEITEFYKGLFYQFLTFQILILLVWSSYNSGSAIKEEILNKSYDFFRMLPLPAHKKTLGIVIGKNLVVFLFAAINMVLLIYFGLSGGINVNLIAQVFLILISITIFANLIMLLSSTTPGKKGGSSGIIFILLFVFFLVPMIINLTVALASTDDLESFAVNFFTMEIPILLLVSYISLYFSCWIFKGILRRFTYEQESLFTRKGAPLFLLGYIILVIGLYYTYIPTEATELIYSYWIVTLIPVLLISRGSLRKFENYIEYSRNFQNKLSSRATTNFSILIYSNLSLTIALFAIWAVSSIGITFFASSAEMELLSNLYNIFVLFTCYLFLILLLELYVVYKPVSNKIGLLLGFIVVLYIILPLILAGIFDSETILLYSPAGFIVSLFENSGSSTINTYPWLMNIIFCLLPALLIWKRYNFILVQRQKM